MTATATLPRGTKNGTTPAPLPPELATQLLRIPLESIDVGENVRVNIAELEELTASISEHGILQPVKAVEVVGGRYRLVWGQRRVLAARQAGLVEIPAIVELEHVDVADAGSARAIEQLVENLHRADLNPIDRARAMRAVVDAGVSQADLARKLGIGASTVSNDLRLLEASPVIHAALEKGEITAAHAKAMLPLPIKDQEYFAGRVRAGNLSAHRLEEEVGWKLQTIRGEEAAQTRAEKQAPKLIAALEAAGVTKDTKVQLQQPYNMRGPTLEAAIQKAGWTLQGRGYAYERGDDSKCDCSVVRVEFNRSWKVVQACVDDRHRDRQRNHDHVAEEKRRKAIATKVRRLGELVAVLLEGLPPELVKLLAVTHRDQLVEKWASDDLVALRAAAGAGIAAAGDTTYGWPQESRPAQDAVLDEVLAAFERLAGATSEAPA